jgi:hypothetical protein
MLRRLPARWACMAWRSRPKQQAVALVAPRVHATCHMPPDATLSKVFQQDAPPCMSHRHPHPCHTASGPSGQEGVPDCRHAAGGH